jgi:hypothetical protein
MNDELRINEFYELTNRDVQNTISQFSKSVNSWLKVSIYSDWATIIGYEIDD